MRLMTTKNNTNRGFSLLELLIVAGLSVMVMMTVTTLFLTFIITSRKSNIKQKVHAEGEEALNKIEFILRNSQKLVPGLDGATICNNDNDNPMTDIAIQGLDGYVTTLQTYPLTDGQIASYSTAINDYYYLTSDETELSNLEFICLSGEENAYYVNVSFDLKIGSGASSDKETAVEHFQTGITLRNN
ncbi:MAG: type II secretion system protein [Candidatus Pacebacteria bacterium]|nr:type II secretion system protein [Candidatus Paceibacterota bacterium]